MSVSYPIVDKLPLQHATWSCLKYLCLIFHVGIIEILVQKNDGASDLIMSSICKKSEAYCLTKVIMTENERTLPMMHQYSIECTLPDLRLINVFCLHWFMMQTVICLLFRPLLCRILARALVVISYLFHAMGRMINLTLFIHSGRNLLKKKCQP